MLQSFRNLLDVFKKLPPELKVLLMLAGVGTPVAAVAILRKWVFGSSVPLPTVILYVALAGGAVFIVGYGVYWLFSIGARRRRGEMASHMADAALGGTAVDIRAAVKANNEKFFAAIRDMRKNVGLNVYDLPWYIVIGDSGCGKTKLINEGGLTFSTGKPEGYQLGTLNYNWWFSEDAIFIDMAGRLCNPRDDADRREWEAFLAMVSKGRRGFPINGALVCVSADHLLQDSVERVEQDANTMLERLRDLQSKLGVTFATYLLVTKCDKILGFIPFFERADRDITVKNQIFGWSKPGTFQELQDPERFGAEFEQVYVRLHDLRLRRLSDDSDEQDLGLAYGFAEEWRELLSPLQIYVRTLFPLIKNPKAVRNLVFRGVYFTSATQEGSLILKHLTERLGAEAASRFAPLDLYPNKRPHFIKDLLFRKVFPEHGLVFRNEQQVVRNRQLTRLLRWGSAALFVLLAVTLGVSSYRFGQTITQPREFAKSCTPGKSVSGDVNAAVADGSGAMPIRVQGWTPADALAAAVKLGDHRTSLESKRIWANILSLFLGAERPLNDLAAIRAGLFDRVLLPQALGEISQALRSKELSPSSAADADAYREAVLNYVVWYSCAKEPAVPPAVTAAGFQSMGAIVADGKSLLVSEKDAVAKLATASFESLLTDPKWANPARHLLREEPTSPVRARETLVTALRTVYSSFSRLAALGDDNPDATIRGWMDLQRQCEAIESAYDELLKLGAPVPTTVERFEPYRSKFLDQYAKFAKSLESVAHRSATNRLLVPALFELRGTWYAYAKRLEEALRRCSTNADPNVQAALASLTQGDESKGWKALDQVFWESLRKARLTEVAYDPGHFKDLETFERHVREVAEAFPHLLSGSDELTRVAAVLAPIDESLRSLSTEPGADFGTPGKWVLELERLLDRKPPAPLNIGVLDAYWKKEKLEQLHRTHGQVASLAQGSHLLKSIEKGLEPYASPQTWGIAQLVPGWNEVRNSNFDIPVPTLTIRAVEPTRRDDPASVEKPTGLRSRRGDPGTLPQGGQIGAVQGESHIPHCAQPSFLRDRANEAADLLFRLSDFDSSFHLQGGSDAPTAARGIAAVEAAGKAYFQHYLAAWATAYGALKLPKLDRLMDNTNWKQLTQQLESDRGAVVDEFRPALAEILEATVFRAWEFRGQAWVPIASEDQAWKKVESWLRTAEQLWPEQERGFLEHGRTLEGVELKKANDPPWVKTAAEFGRVWSEVARAIGSLALLPEKFDNAPVSWNPVRVPWEILPRLRADANLIDERITGRLLEFQERARKLLNQELTVRLVGVQTATVGDRSPFRGWPYLNESAVGAKALETVGFEEFKRLLLAADRAQKAFAIPEEGLPDDEIARPRNEFHRACAAWRTFLGLSEPPFSTPKKISLTIDWVDPTSLSWADPRVDDSPQQHYARAQLDLGLTVSGGQRDLEVFTRTADRKGGPIKVDWEWADSVARKEVQIRLVGSDTSPSFPDVSSSIGESSPLALCAYLNRYGRGDDRARRTVHGFRLRDEMQKRGRTDLTLDASKSVWGVALEFRFPEDRPFPEPIHKLDRP